MFGLLAAAVLAPVTVAKAAPAPERENEATDELLGGQVSSEELEKQPPPKSKPDPSSETKKETPSKTKPEPAQTDEAAGNKSPPNAPGFVAPPDPGSSAAGKAEVAAEDGDDDNDKKKKKSRRDDADDGPTDPGMSHHNQGSITVMPGWGFSAIVPYQDDIFCGEFSDDPGSDTKRKSFCTMASPWFMEITGGFGAHPRLDVVLGLRINLQKRDFDCRDGDDPSTCKGMFNRKVAVGLAPGIRAWISRPERKFKIGGAVDFIWMHESFGGYREREPCTGPDDQDNGPCPLMEGPIEPEEQDIKDDDIGFRLGPVLQIDPHRNVGIVILPAARMGLLRWFEFSFDLGIGIQARFP